ncbi:MAG: hypothetical protein ABI895_23365 [Deltaproteobacteria bacterium]
MSQTWADPDVLGAVAVELPRLQNLPRASRATSPPGPEGLALVGSLLERSLVRLLGPSVTLDLLLERALLEVLSSWPPRDDTALPLWAQRIAVSWALDALKSRASASDEEQRQVRPGRVREALSHLQTWMRGVRPEEQLAFALLELNASSMDEAAAILCVPPQVVRQRARRVRRALLFAARRDLELRRYLLVALRVRSLLRCWDRAALQAPPSQRTRRVSAELELELQWFV